MELRMETKSWKLDTKDGQKIISGKYAVKCGKDIIAEKSFNGEYDSITVVLPASLVAKAEELDEEIRQAIINSFEK